VGRGRHCAITDRQTLLIFVIRGVYQLQTTFRSVNNSLLQVLVFVPLRPISPHLWKYTPLPVPHPSRAALVVAHNYLLAISSDADVVMSFPGAQLHACTKLGHTFLCHYSGTATTSASSDCLAAIFIQNTAAAAARCHTLQVGDWFYAACVDSHSFAVFVPTSTTCIITCPAASTTPAIHGFQLVDLDLGCSATVGDCRPFCVRRYANTTNPTKHTGSGSGTQQFCLDSGCTALRSAVAQ
jgi:hypothetical protein